MRVIAQVLHLSNDVVLHFLLFLIIKHQEIFKDLLINDVKHNERYDDSENHLNVTRKDRSKHWPMEDYLKRPNQCQDVNHPSS